MAVNPITQIISYKYSSLIKERFIAFSEFEYQGKKPFENFTFHNKLKKVGVLAVLGNLSQIKE